MIAAGFRRYGFDDLSERLFNAIVDAATEFPAHRLPELFGGFPRDEFGVPVPYTVANHPQAWSADAIPYMLAT